MAGAELRTDFWLSEYLTPWDVYAHGITRILASCQTPYQEMYVAETGSYGKALILDGKWQSSTVDEFLYHEALVHPAMIAHRSPRRVLILGGAEGATVREVLRWQTVERVVMVDIDGEVVEACRTHLPEMHQNAFEDPRVELVIDDALNFLDQTTQQWDVIISDLTDPIESGPAFQLFTQEHYQQIQRVLASDGVFALQAGPISLPELYLHARVVKTLQSVFPAVRSCLCPATSYGVPIAFALVSQQEIAIHLDPKAVDRLLAQTTTGGFRLIDGVSLQGLLQIPLHIRQAIEAETEIYTLQSPPKPFGKGSMASSGSTL
ncbi:spermine/spermidine synthase domain-containing protein [Egbenema bharatensis]|uniref:spermine/spermidine synthase domain-containing protein n=1 Tax=Egbenema bharatensis TaxID=3463334 RepID=UPI003A86A283